jgi:hypothetical protein
MKKGMLLVGILSVFLTVVPAFGQGSETKATAKVPFDFVVGSTVLPAGDYAIRTAGMDRTRFIIQNKGRFELFSGRRSQVQTSTVEIDRMDEVLFIPKPSGCVFHPLDLGIQRFAGGIRDLML